jgi:hypothetical protein
MSNGYTRRSFTESLALAALAPALGVRPRSLDLPWGGNVAPLALESDEPGALAKALAGAIRAQYGSRLGRVEVATITRQIQTGLDRAAQIRRIALANGDEPDFVFSARPLERSQ